MTDSSPSDEPVGLSAMSRQPGAPGAATDDPVTADPVADDLVTDDLVADDLVVVDDLERIELFGMQMVNAEGLAPVIDELLDGPRRDDEVLPVVLTPNVDIVVHLNEDPDSIEAEMFRRCLLYTSPSPRDA